MIEKVLFVLLGVLLSGLGFLIKRRVEGKPKQEALDIQKKVLEIHKQMNEQGLDIDSLKTFENNLIGKNAAIQRHSTELQAETTPLIDESENRNLSQIELTQRASDKLEKVGPAYKGIPIATTTAVALADHHDVDTPYCFNRKEAKNHGEGGNLVGSALEGRIMLVDDVITAGTAIRESMEIIQANGADLAGVLVAIDRQEKGKGELSAIQEVERDFGCAIISIVSLTDLVTFLEEKGTDAAHLESVKAYRAQYGI